METLKKYLPFIILIVVGYFLLKKFSGGSKGVSFLPQTQFSQQQQIDPLAEVRSKAFDTLASLGIAQTQSDITREQNAQNFAIAGKSLDVQSQGQGYQFQLGSQGIASDLESRLRGFDIAQRLGLASNETDLAKANLNTELAKYLQSQQLSFNMFQQNAYLQALQLQLQQRDQDRQLQQAAIDRYYSSRNTGSIIGSISQALAGIFGGGATGGGTFRTPPIFGFESFDSAPTGINFPGGF